MAAAAASCRTLPERQNDIINNMCHIYKCLLQHVGVPTYKVTQYNKTKKIIIYR